MLFAVSVTTNCTSTPERCTLPASTMPPMRKVFPFGASLAATCEGVKKNTRFFSKAISTSAVAMPSAATPSAIAAMRLCLGFTLPLAVHQHDDFGRQQREADEVSAPDVAHSRSRMMQRTRAIDTAMLYSQNASAMRIMPRSMVAAMLGARVKLTEAPW